MTVPAFLSEYLVDAALHGRRAAWIVTTTEGAVVRGVGELAHYGYAGLEVGRSIEAQIDFLEGLFPLVSESVRLPYVETRHGHYADVRLGTTREGAFVLMLDADEEVRAQSALLQKGNDLSFLLQRIGDRLETGTEPAGFATLAGELARGQSLNSIFRALNIFVLERVGPDVFVPLGRAPRWAQVLFGEAARRRTELRPGERLPFLENFLIDAEPHWASGSRERLRSGLWMEDINGLGECALDAVAISVEKRRSFLLIQHMDDAFEKQREVIQQAREARLDYLSLRKEIERKEVLLHCIVHDLKAPLAGMMGSLSVLGRGKLSAEQETELAELGLTQARRQDDMIRNILEVFAAEVSSLENFDAEPENAPYLAPCVLRAADSYRRSAEDAGLTLELDCPPGIQVVGDASRLERIVANLLENAVRYGPRGTTVRLAVEVAEDLVEVSVEDAGPGVPEAARGTLFRKFARDGSSRSGTGLGLFFCKITVEAWGGTIGYAERDGGGSRFWFRLPRVA